MMFQYCIVCAQYYFLPKTIIRHTCSEQCEHEFNQLSELSADEQKGFAYDNNIINNEHHVDEADHLCSRR
ncbi:hypothetical protein [Caudoviricetes sp.]|nr:hypothetical protein [Caudoviricetes sp.]UOF79115.1 hypothetical protein [Caudoviricetes sp.]